MPGILLIELFKYLVSLIWCDADKNAEREGGREREIDEHERDRGRERIFVEQLTRCDFISVVRKIGIEHIEHAVMCTKGTYNCFRTIMQFPF